MNMTERDRTLLFERGGFRSERIGSIPGDQGDLETVVHLTFTDEIPSSRMLGVLLSVIRARFGRLKSTVEFRPMDSEFPHSSVQGWALLEAVQGAYEIPESFRLNWDSLRSPKDNKGSAVYTGDATTDSPQHVLELGTARQDRTILDAEEMAGLVVYRLLNSEPVS